MAAKRILQLGDPTLRVVSAPVGEVTEARETLLDLSATLAEFRRSHGFGRGISAIQIGVAQRVIFLRFEDTDYELINPAYHFKSEERFEMWDDCFSFPNLMVRLKRHVAVGINFTDLSGTKRTLEASGPLSELIQHEMDHLDGVLAVDHAGSPDNLATREEYLRRYVSSVRT